MTDDTMTIEEVREAEDAEALERGLRALDAAGIAYAEGRPLPTLNPHVVYELTGGEQGKPFEEERGLPLLGAQRVLLRAAERLAELYLEETGLKASPAARAAGIETGEILRVFGKLSREEHRELANATRRLAALNDLARLLVSEGTAVLHSRNGESVTLEGLVEEDRVSEEDVATARAILEERRQDREPLRVTLGRDTGGSGFHQELPGAAEAQATYDRLTEKALPSEEERAEVLAELLTDETGEQQPSLRAWLENRDRGDLLDLTTAALRRIATERRAEAAEERAADAEAEAKRLRNLHARDLPSNVRVPQIFQDNVLAGRQDWQDQLDQLSLFENDGKLANRPDVRQRAILEEEARLDVQPTHWDLSTQEWRLLHAVYGLYTATGLEGETYAREYVPEDWPRLYAAAGLPENTEARGKRGDFSHQRREHLQEAMDSLASVPGVPGSGRRVPVFVSRKQSNDKWAIMAEEVSILRRLPVWADRSEEEAEALRSRPPQDWPEPDGWALRLPKALRYGLDNYFREIPVDLWQRLERAAGEIQGRNRGVQARDWTFALWLYKQRPQKREEGDRLRFFLHVDRDDLADRIPALRTYRDNRQRRRLERYTRQTYEIARRAGLLQDYKLSVPTTAGIRDVLYLEPERFPQLERERRATLQGALLESGAE